MTTVLCPSLLGLINPSEQATKPNHVEDQAASKPPNQSAARVGGLNHADQNHNGGTGHGEDRAPEERPLLVTSTTGPRMRSAEIHGSKLKEKKRQKQQQQRWSFTENPSEGSTSSSGGTETAAKMASRTSAGGAVVTVRIIDKRQLTSGIQPRPV